VCLDLEGVLIPEMWVAFAEATGVEALKRTTRDEPDYDVLMRYRLDVLAEHSYTLADIQEVVSTLRPLDGAREFIHWLRARARVIILSDTFEEFAGPLMAQLDFPTLFCHNLEIGDDGKIANYCLRQPDQKRKAVLALRGLNFDILAAGDSYNDLTMLQTADHGFLFRPPASLVEEHPEFPVAKDHAELRQLLEPHL
ncbi:MAG: bifunctional phosphoserine phosphatase/homoserine phosphotransferase ThrH, partial [Verrucomicrobiota bacterium]